MAQDQVIRAAAAAVLVLAGAAAAAAGSDLSAGLRAADLLVGAGLAVAALWVLPATAWVGLLGVAVAAAWFLGSVTEDLVLAYRAPLLTLLLLTPAWPRGGRALAVAAWPAALVPVAVAGPATAVIAGAGALAQLAAARGDPAGRRVVRTVCAALLAASSVTWGLAAAGVEGAQPLLVTDALTLAGGWAALAAASGRWAPGGHEPLVVDLPRRAAAAMPVTERMARALADPALTIRYAVPGAGWVDERGLAAPAPDGAAHRVTRAAAPGGGEVVLLHGDAAPRDERLEAAAAAAAALALDAARLDAEVRGRATEVREARRRLLTAGDAERRALAERLEHGPLMRLRRVTERVGGQDALAARELGVAQEELLALGRGLYPPFVGRGRIADALREMGERSPVPAAVELDGELAALPEELQATVWFVCSEALANVARHARARHATVRVAAAAHAVVVEIGDDGCGGARLERGLRGLADRVGALGGHLDVASPPGGPTLLRVTLPR